MAENDLLIDRAHQDRMASEALEYQPTPEEASIANTIKRRWEERDKYKRTYEKTWFVNGSFIRGQHYVHYNPGTRNFEVPYKVPQHRVRLVVNYILAYYRRTKSRLTANKPTLFTRPASTDQNDIEISHLAGKVLESELYRMGFQSKFKGTVGWSLEAGSGILYLGWNPRAGAPLYEDQPVLDEYGQPMVDPETGEPATQRVPLTEGGRQLFEGQNELDICSPYEIDQDPNATGFDDAEWATRSKIRSLTWIRDNYREYGRFVKKESVELHSFYQKRIQQMVGVLGYVNDADTSEGFEPLDPASAVVHEYWERASTRYPQGRLVVVANGVVLWNGPNPYRHQLMPFVKIDEITVSSRFWGMSIIEHLIPLQKNYNRGRSQEVENRTIMSRPKWLVPRSAKVRQASLDAEAGEKIDYTVGPRGERPEVLVPPSTVNATQYEVNQTINDMQEVGAWHEASRGVMPSANAPGIAIQRLQEADDTSLGETSGNIDLALERLGRMLLSNCAQFWSEERLVRVGGDSARLEASRVRGSDLVGSESGGDYYDVRLVPGSTLRRDPEEQRAKVKELMGLGVLDPVAHRDLILKMLNIGEIEQAFEDEVQEEQWASKENEMMETGVFVIPRDFESHDIHIKVLDRYRKSQRYRELQPVLQKLFDQHAELHKQLAVAVGQEKVLMQAMVESVVNPQVMAGGEEAGAPEGGEKEAPASQGKEE